MDLQHRSQIAFDVTINEQHRLLRIVYASVDGQCRLAMLWLVMLWLVSSGLLNSSIITSGMLLYNRQL